VPESLQVQGPLGEFALPKCILIVDDNATVRKAVRSLLEAQEGFEVCGEAANGREAVDKAQELAPDLIIMDLSMPVMNGLEAARTLREVMPDVPIVMFSVHRSGILEKNARSAGIRAVVPKGDHTSLVRQARSILEASGGRPH
jgi:two-component system, NarL family, nitrate/nitrite response regulator NarL